MALYVNIKILFNTLYYILTLPFKKNVVVANCFLDLYFGKFKSSNFGDDLNYFIIKELTGMSLVCYNNLLFRKLGLKITNISCIGSVIDMLTDNKTIVWGTGAISAQRQMSEKPYKVLAVRGPLTRKFLLENGISCPKCYGDPALLLPRLYTPKFIKKFKVGIIPHYVDLNNEVVIRLLKLFGADCKLINVSCYGHWHDIVDEIVSCEFILSSSLHGLIVSDAYCIPNVWVEFSNKVWGNGFKFYDYYASVNRDNVSPCIIEDTFDVKDILGLRLRWKPIDIDLSGLINSCPFARKQLLLQTD